jgi:hypothetical protein
MDEMIAWGLVKVNVETLLEKGINTDEELRRF